MTRVLIADDHKMMLEGWQTILANEDKFHIVGAVANSQGIVEFFEKKEADLLVTDIDMGKTRDDGLSAIRILRNTHPSLLILVVSMHDEIGFIDDAMEAGAHGYILKSNSTEEMVTAMNQIVMGKPYFSQEVMRKVAGRMRRQNESDHIHLTNREKKVLPLLCHGLSSKEIGQKLGISHNTVNTYRKQLYSKFGINKISELINRSRELGYFK